MNRLCTCAIAVLAIALLTSATPASSETERADPTAASENKQELILEILSAAGDDQMAAQMIQVFLVQLRPAYRDMIAEIMKTEQDLTEEEKALLVERLDDFERFAERFSALLPERLDFESVRIAVYAPLYDRNFDEQELKEIAAFYKSPTGQKVLQVMPGLMEEGMKATFRATQPRVMEVVGEVLAEQRGASLSTP